MGFCLFVCLFGFVWFFGFFNQPVSKDKGVYLAGKSYDIWRWFMCVFQSCRDTYRGSIMSLGSFLNLVSITSLPKNYHKADQKIKSYALCTMNPYSIYRLGWKLQRGLFGLLFTSVLCMFTSSNAVEVSEQEGKLRDDIWFSIIPTAWARILPSRSTKAKKFPWVAFQELINTSPKSGPFCKRPCGRHVIKKANPKTLIQKNRILNRPENVLEASKNISSVTKPGIKSGSVGFQQPLCCY